MKKKRVAVFSGGLLFIVAILLACSASDSSKNQGQKVNATDNQPTQQSVAPQHFKVGEVVKVGDIWEVTVNSTTKNGGSDFNLPKEGNTFLLVNVTLKNISAKEQTASSLLMFNLKDSTGQKAEVAFFTDANASPDGKIEVGGQLKGDLSYQVPTGETKFVLSFQADLLNNGQTIWDLEAA